MERICSAQNLWDSDKKRAEKEPLGRCTLTQGSHQLAPQLCDPSTCQPYQIKKLLKEIRDILKSQ